MDFFELETKTPEIINSKYFTIFFNKNEFEFSLTSLKIELYSNNVIEFRVTLINLKESLLFQNVYEQTELLKNFKINSENKTNIFELCCELAENKKIKTNLKDKYEVLNLILESEVKKILFNELAKKNVAVEMKTEMSFNLNQLNKIQEQMQKVLYQIIITNNNNSENEEIESGIGFIIKINYKEYDYILLLITNTQVLNEKNIKNETGIILNTLIFIQI